MTDWPPGIVRTPRGFRAFQWIPAAGYPRGRIASKRFPADTPIETMQRWRTAQRIAARQGQTARALDQQAVSGAGFLADADRYLATVRAMPSWQERRRELRAWAAVLGEQDTLTITSTQIRAARDQWLTIGPKRVQQRQATGQMAWIEQPLPLAPQSVNLRLRALENLFTVLYPTHPNPVRAVDEVRPPPPAPRGETFSLALEILSFMPDVTTPKPGAVAEAGSKSRARFEVMLWTGLTLKQVGRLTPDAIDWTTATMRPPPRGKGRLGHHRQRGRVRVTAARPLLPQAVAALRQLFALGANTPFQSSSITRSVKAAMRAANRVRAAKGVPLIPLTLRLYDLTRHTFGTELYRATRRLEHVQTLLGHADPAMSQRYAAAAIRDDLLVGMAELGKRARRAQPRGGKAGKVSPLRPGMSRSVTLQRGSKTRQKR